MVLIFLNCDFKFRGIKEIKIIIPIVAKQFQNSKMRK